VLAINGLPVSRKTLWRIQYVYNHLRPQPGLRLTLAAQSGDPRHLDVMAKLEINHVVKYALHQGVNQMAQDWDEEGRLLEPQYFENGDAFLAIRIPAFAISAEEMDRIFGKMRKHKGVVLDLRGNPGGFEDMVDRMVGALFQNDVKVYGRVRPTRPGQSRFLDAITMRSRENLRSWWIAGQLLPRNCLPGLYSWKDVVISSGIAPLVPNLEAFLFGIAVRMNSDDVAAVTNHPQPKTVFVDVVARRRDKGRVRIVEAVEQGGNLRDCRIHRIRLGDILLGLLDFCVPVQAMQLGIVIVLLYVRSNGTQHLQGVVTIKLR
jgi:Peptidase family S41